MGAGAGAAAAKRPVARGAIAARGANRSPPPEKAHPDREDLGSCRVLHQACPPEKAGQGLGFSFFLDLTPSVSSGF